MKRRKFVGSIAAGVVFGTMRAFGQSAVAGPDLVLVRAGMDRRGHRRKMVGGRVDFDAKVSTEDTGGGMFLWENSIAEKSGPGRHVHLDQEEWFYVLQGDYVMEIGERQVVLRPGDSVYLPRKVPHAWAHVSEGVGRLLGAVQPAGMFEAFVADDSMRGPTTSATIRKLEEVYRIRSVGPPIDTSNLAILK